MKDDDFEEIIKSIFIIFFLLILSAIASGIVIKISGVQFDNRFVNWLFTAIPEPRESIKEYSRLIVYWLFLGPLSVIFVVYRMFDSEDSIFHIIVIILVGPFGALYMLILYLHRESFIVGRSDVPAFIFFAGSALYTFLVYVMVEKYRNPMLFIG